MRKTLTRNLPIDIPEDFYPLFKGEIYDSSSSPEAKVIYSPADGGYYLKTSARGSLKNEALMTSYFHKIGLGSEVIGYRQTENCDFLLTKALAGEDLTHVMYLSEPERLCDTLAERLRALHQYNFDLCPIKNRMPSYFDLAKKNYLRGAFDLSFYSDIFGEKSADYLYSLAKEGSSSLSDRSLLHGDYCLPNLIFSDWSFSGFIDLGNGGIGDRHIDIYWGAWTLLFNLRTDKYRERFFDAYGKDKIEIEKLKIVAATECFG